MDEPTLHEIVPGVAVSYASQLDENGHATTGQVIHKRPSPEELDFAGIRIAAIRSNIFVLRTELQNFRKAWAPHESDDKTYRDVEGLLTAALVMLYEPKQRFPNWATTKREQLAHPETYVIEEGFSTGGLAGNEMGLVEQLWWDEYHKRFGPNLVPMPWRGSY